MEHTKAAMTATVTTDTTVPTVYLSLSYDHRIVDGADADRYLGDVKIRLESGYTADLLD
ncbi:MAG: 2-oxo acid dehydrogenase subunit E2 [Rhodococcus sp. (in: high G+C Gram-positive bacteria)]|nr:2-oxo acid dehydrogenase subunit E2 [Rhodococcus sp. (in: high G+C Gram-positive bacteria)]MDI6628246.1 2-oxo acid dehydrogenase subunit E2 [Rhodococcus sp. (in: high G+C Gram-positive bacteria)]